MDRINFVGAGNMATSMIAGLISRGRDAGTITATDRNPDALELLSRQFGIQTSTNNAVACEQADIVILAVKPQVMQSVAEGLQPALAHGPLVISIAAGISSRQLGQWLGNGPTIVRCMPNTPALVKQGASGLYATAGVSDAQKQKVEALLNAVGISVWVEKEELMDAVTAVSGSGPAYFFLLMEAMIDAAVKQGLAPEQARRLTLQTAAGAATLAWQADVNVDELRRRVTSPGGTTEQAISCFEGANFRQIVDDAMMACARRSKSMAEEFD